MLFIFTASDEDGDLREITHFSRDEAPSIGEHFELEGLRLRRVPDMPQRPIVKGVGHIAHSLPTGFDEHNQPLIKGAGGYLEDGTPVITSQRDIDAIERNHPEYKHGANKHRLNLD